MYGILMLAGFLGGGALGAALGGGIGWLAGGSTGAARTLAGLVLPGGLLGLSLAIRARDRARWRDLARERLRPMSKVTLVALPGLSALGALIGVFIHAEDTTQNVFVPLATSMVGGLIGMIVGGLYEQAFTKPPAPRADEPDEPQPAPMSAEQTADPPDPVRAENVAFGVLLLIVLAIVLAVTGCRRDSKAQDRDGPLLPQDWPPHMRVEHGLPPGSVEEVKILLDRINSNDLAAASKAMSLLPKISPDCTEAIPLLRRAMGSSNLFVATAATHALAKVWPQEIVKALRSPDASVRFKALGAMLRFRPQPQQVVPKLIDALGDGDPGVRATAAHALGLLGADAPGAVEALKRACNDDTSEVRAAAADALKKIRSS